MFSKSNIFTAVWTVVAVVVAYVIIDRVVAPKMDAPSTSTEA